MRIPLSKQRTPAPRAADRWRFWGLLILALALGWFVCLLWMLASYIGLQGWIREHLDWPLGWMGAFMPRRSDPISWMYNHDWFTWGPGPGSLWTEGVPPPANLWEVIIHASARAWQPLWLPVPGYRGGRHTQSHSVWWFIGLWHFGSVFAARFIWDRWGALRRVASCPGHLLCAGALEFRTGLLAGVMSAPLLAVWRVERGLWETAILYGSPAGRWTTITMDKDVMTIMLMQIVLLHWLIVWWVYRWMLRRGVRRGAVVSSLTDRCPSCGYKSESLRCPECGADRNDPNANRPRVFIPCIEKRAWLRWIFRTRTALGAIVFLFFAPVWTPLIRMGFAMIVP